VVATAMASRLAAFSESLGPARAEAARVPSELRERLAALGYVGGAPRAHKAMGRDPKDFIAEYNQIGRGRRSSWLEPVVPLGSER